MKNIITMAGFLLLVAAVWSDLSWGKIGFDTDGSLDSNYALEEARTKAVPAVPGRILPARHVAGNEPAGPDQDVEWVSIAGSIAGWRFIMGTEDDDNDEWFKNAKPIHQVYIKTFEVSKTLVTVEQYRSCVIRGWCTEPGTGGSCNWGVAGRQRHPINCVDWYQANKYAKFKGARLPSESEYEYAAKCGGMSDCMGRRRYAQKYPWGDKDPTRNNDKVVMSVDSTMPVCSKPAGNAKVSGGELCDMVGNVWEWMQDEYQSSYAGAPNDGSAFEGTGSYRVMRGDSVRTVFANRVLRGGSFESNDLRLLRADYRFSAGPGNRSGDVGFRLARDRARVSR